MIYVECLLSFRNLEFSYMADREHLCYQTPIKTLSTEFLTSFPGRQHAVDFKVGGTMSVLCDSSDGSLHLVSFAL